MIETAVRTPKPGDVVRFRDSSGDREGPARVLSADAPGLRGGSVYLDPRPDLGAPEYRFDVPHGDVRTRAGVWSFPDEVEPHWLPDR
jgi:hypothetical protein